mgnify:CR=1 FL=1
MRITTYKHLDSRERAQLMAGLAAGRSQSAMARELGRDRSTISRELQRNGARLDRDTGARPQYDAVAAQRRADELAHAPGPSKLVPETPLFGAVQTMLEAKWSPEQIASQLQREYPDEPKKRVCHETIYTAIYAQPYGELRRQLIAHLRQAHGKRRPRSRGDDRRGQIADMVSIAVRPPEVGDRLVPGHWEGDLIKGKANKSCIGTLVERTTRLVLLARMDGGDAEAALAGFERILSRVHAPMRKTLTYDRGKEMARHKELTERTGVQVYFADPHSPWQRGSNENTNGLLRQYFPKGTDLSRFTQDELDAVAWEMNCRPRKTLGWMSPFEAYAKSLGLGPFAPKP